MSHQTAPSDATRLFGRCMACLLTLACILFTGVATAQMGTPDDPYDPNDPGHDGNGGSASIADPGTIENPKFLSPSSYVSMAGAQEFDSCFTSVCLVIDVSGSMGSGGKLGYAKSAANTAIDSMDVDDRMAIVSFSNCYTVVQGFTSDTALLHAAVNGLSAGGFTAALDGIWAGVDLTTSEVGSKAVIALSDGMENRSQFCSGDPDGLGDGFADDSALIVNLALGDDIPIYTVSLGGSFDPQYLIGLAAGSGGSYFHSATGTDLDSIYSLIWYGAGNPSITCPGDQQYQCVASVASCDPNNASVSGGVQPYTVMCDSTDNGGSGCNGDPLVITYTYSVIDHCGKVDTCVQTITVEDDTAPVLSGCPSNTSAECDNVPAPANVTATDNCDASPSVTYSQDSAGSCPYTLTRKWVAEDACGNKDSCTQTITVDDTTDPVCGTINDTTITFCSASQVSIPVSATDNCDNDVSCAVISGPGSVVGGNWVYTPSGDEVANVTIECTDDCGNTCQESFTVTFEANEAPTCMFTGGNSPPVCTSPLHLVTFSHSDPDGDTLTCTNTNASATLGDGTWTYSPTPGEHVVDTITCCDPCGECCELIIDITFPNPAPPVCEVPDDTTIFQCDAAEVCLPAFATGATCSIVSGPGALVGTNWCYTPEGDETANVIIECAGICDTCTGSFSVTFVIGAPPDLTCPGNLTVDCEADVPACDPDDATVSGGTAPVTVTCSSADNGGTGCTGDPKVYTYTYIATDSCGKADTCSRTITVEDSEAPVLSGCPADVTVECDAIPSAASPTATDNCDTNVDIAFSENSNLNGCGGYTGTIVRQWVATDDCGNADTCTQTITVQDNTPPTISGCPADATVECDAILAPASPTASDNCDASVDLAFTETPNLSGCGGYTGTITRQWVATDDCGNADTCTQILTVVDNTAPVVTCPANVTVECGTPTDPGTTGFATASDNCDASPTVTHSDTETPGACPQEKTISREWVATDACGNADTCVQTITVEDNTAPVLSGCPADVTVECDAIPAPASPTATDNCDPSVDIAFTETPNLNGCGGYTGTIVRQWVATDDCGNADTCTQTITVEDNTRPVLTLDVDSLSDFQCIDDVPDCDVAGRATATDNCDPSVDITCERSSVGTGCPGSTMFIVDKYVAVDDCGNADTAVINWTVLDNIDPVLTCPSNVTVQCGDPTDPGSTGMATATDNCDPNPSVTFSDSESPGLCPQEKTIQRTWTATDACGNDAQCVQTIQVVDDTPPMITGCPADVTVECDAIPAPANPTATDNCDPSVDISFTETPNLNGCGGYTGTIVRQWIATDDCGNADTCTQTITVEDTTPPVLSGCPSDVTAECDNIPPIPPNPSILDNCDQNPTLAFTETPNLNGCGGYTGTIVRQWVATDACGNADTCTQVITVEDNTPPSVACPTYIITDFQCLTDVPACDAGAAIATDNCDQDVEIICERSDNGGSGCPGDQLVITDTYIATDDCGNADTCEVTFTVLDDTPPVITGCPSNQSVSCVADIPPFDPGSVSATDNCGNVSISCDTTDNGGSGCNGDPLIMTFTCIATDDCGNSANCEFTVTVEDNTPPTITQCPGAATYQCEGDVPPADIGSVTASDNCGNVTITHGGDTPLSGGACGGTITRTYIATDDCGNADTCTQVITIDDTEAPEITCLAPPPYIYSCVSDLPVCNSGMASATDNCDNDVDISCSRTDNGGSGCANSPLEVTDRYIATDDCGNADTCEVLYTVVDDVDPVVNCPPDLFLGCDDPIPQCSPSDVIASDNCGNVFIVCERMDSTGSGQSGDPIIIVDQYAIDDECGNEVICERTIRLTCNDTPCLVSIAIGPQPDGRVDALNGEQVQVPIIITEVDDDIGGFDLLLCYDQTALSLLDVNIGQAIEEWEYFTYRLGLFGNGNCGGGCPNGYVRILGIADLDNGSQPSDPAFQPIGVIAELNFQVTPDRNFIDQCIPVRFCWFDCGDNTVASKSGDTTFIHESIIFDTCQSNPKGDPVPGLCLTDGIVCIMEPPDDRGDLNLNGIANEVGDAVLYTNYFIYGMSVWNPTYEAVQLLASDINDDGIVLTVADLIYLIRIITGDVQPFPPGGNPKTSPYVNVGHVKYEVSDGALSVMTSSPVDLGGAMFVFRYSGMAIGDVELTTPVEGMTLTANANNGELRVLVAPTIEQPSSLNAGTFELFHVPVSGSGEIELVETQLSDRSGGLMTVNAAGVARPDRYALGQNYPNPFNAGTIIPFDLVESGDWTLRVYNVAGQTIRSYNGHSNAGHVEVPWDGTNQDGRPAASGIYFYRVDSKSFTQTRKMTLLK